jgi:LCP family protein required for cell wall assembly
MDDERGDVLAAVGAPRAGERINVLLLGVDATKRRTQTLTDTMIVASLDPVGWTISMASIPRDLIDVPLGNGDTYGPKINSLYGYADRHPDLFPRGPERTLQDAIGALLGIPIHYYARLDFDGFIDIIDAVGGVDVTVKRGFSDPRYDGVGLDGRGFSIEAGRHHLAGAEALAYARVRMADGETDFTRADRQQQILVALKERLTSAGSVFWSLPDLLDAVGDTVRTDVPVDRLPELAVVIDELGGDSIFRAVIRHPLVKSKSTRYGASLVIRPKSIKAMAAKLFPEPGVQPIPWPTPRPKATESATP